MNAAQRGLRKLVAIGTSQGGLHAASVVLAGIPRHFRLPIVLVQHRSKQSDEALVDALQARSALPVSEPEDKEEIKPARVYVAPPDYHLLVDGMSFALSTEAPVTYSRPSIDVFFESAADAFKEGLVAVLLTGANHDGSRALERVKALGGHVLAEDPFHAESPTMPAAAIATGHVDRILPLAEIPALLAEFAE
jgi:two-component system chemotaxis response regulator CheB